MTRTLVGLAAVTLCITISLTASAQDWKQLADVEEITVITTREDDRSKETTIWLAVLDEEGFIRTSDTNWGENVTRNSEVILRIDGKEYELRAVRIPRGEQFDQVTAVFREKYGFSDVMIGPFRFGEVKILRMDPR
jgi:hypothetical protein